MTLREEVGESIGRYVYCMVMCVYVWVFVCVSVCKKERLLSGAGSLLMGKGILPAGSICP